MKGNIYTTKLYDVILEGDSVFLVMEYQPSDLKTIFKQADLKMNEE